MGLEKNRGAKLQIERDRPKIGLTVTWAIYNSAKFYLNQTIKKIPFFQINSSQDHIQENYFLSGAYVIRKTHPPNIRLDPSVIQHTNTSYGLITNRTFVPAVFKYYLKLVFLLKHSSLGKYTALLMCCGFKFCISNG